MTSITDPIVETKYGKIQGFSLKLENDALANVFLRVPYAEPPVGELRLEKPRPPKPLSNTYNATSFGPSCVQLIRGLPNVKEDEDSLHLNIIAPQEKSPNGYPVLFWIHSGGYELGSAIQYGYNGIAERWAPRGIIVVTINYRLGALGWMSAGDNILPGNLGFWDMTAALKFVRENIRAFGGDPNKITVWGASSGGAAVSALSLSPHSRDLFHQVFQMSGSPFSEWAASEYVTEESVKLAKELNCFDEDSNKIKSGLKKIPIQELQIAYERLGTTRPGLSPILYTPRIDLDFFPKSFKELIKEAPRKPILSGFASQEGAKLTVWPKQLVRGQIIPREEQFQYDRNRFVQFIKNYVASEEYFGSKAKEIQEKILAFYTKEAPESADYKYWLQKYSQLISDTTMNLPQLEEAKLRAEHDWPVYFYHTEYFNNDAIKETFNGDIPVKGAWHLSEYAYLFGFSSLDKFEFNENDWKFQKFWLDVVENFVKTGNPSLPSKELSWPRVTKEKFSFVNISLEPKVEDDLQGDMLKFWKGLAEDYSLDLITREHKNRRKSMDDL